jgi:hypothetical protein
MTRLWVDKALAVGLLVLLGIVIGCSGVGAAPPTADESGSLPFAKNENQEFARGTPVYIRLQHTISSATAEPGDSFTAVLDEPMMLEGKTMIPEGTEISGHVVAARKSGPMHRPGYLRLTLSSLNINGKNVAIQTSSIFIEGGIFNHRNIAYIGGGTGAASLIRGDHDGTGHNAAYVTGKQEVGFTAERRMGFRLLQPLTIG